MNISHAYRKLGGRCLAASFGLVVLTSSADVVELVNGDRYQGTVVSMTEGFLDFQSEIQGRVKLPRAKVATITLHSSTGSKPAVKTTTSPPLGSPIIVAGNNGR